MISVWRQPDILADMVGQIAAQAMELPDFPLPLLLTLLRAEPDAQP